MQSESLKDFLVSGIKLHFGEAVRDFEITERVDFPYLRIVFDVTFYNFAVVRVIVERDVVFVYFMQSGVPLQMLRATLSKDYPQAIFIVLEGEIRLRIPDKYLMAKGWLAPEDGTPSAER